MPNTTTTTRTNNSTITRNPPNIRKSKTKRLYTITLAHIVGDHITFSKTRAPSHAAALKTAREKDATATIRAFYPPYGVSLPLAAMHVTVSTLSGIVKRGVGDVPRQQKQLDIARHTLRSMAQHGTEAVTIPFDIADLFQTAALALVNHTTPHAAIEGKEIQEAYSAAMCAVQKAYRAETRGVQQADAGKEMPRMYGSPTMRSSTPPRPAPKAYRNAIATIRAAYIAQARDKEAAARVMDYWIAHPECTTYDMGDALKINRSNTTRRMADIRRIANELYPNGVNAH